MRRTALAKARSRNRGAVMVEYAFLLAFVAMPGGVAILVGGSKLHQSYVDTRAEILAPAP
jgi:Flp pilus assembly pilin Flp